MSDVIEFLEKLGSDARLFQAARETVAVALADAQVEAAAGEAILARNVEELQALLKVVPLHCFQSAPKREGEEEEEEQEGEESDEGKKPPKKPSKGASQSLVVAHADKLT
jgi:CO dehydrogenase/acetyl-CoA synthase beta subunit